MNIQNIKPTLTDFEIYMAGKKEGGTQPFQFVITASDIEPDYYWIMEVKTENMIKYRLDVPAKKASGCITIILLLLWILPGLLYMYYASRPAKISHIAVSVNPNGELIPSGDERGMRLFKRFQDEFYQIKNIN